MSFVEAERDRLALIAVVFEQLFELLLCRNQTPTRLLVERFQDEGNDRSGSDAPHFCKLWPQQIDSPFRAIGHVNHARFQKTLAGANLADDARKPLMPD